MLELRDITKKFGKHTVLEKVSLQVAPGEIHGLAGLNGSGKSTLLNILFGSRTIAETGGFTGSYQLNGAPCVFRAPAQAVRRGIGMVHQEQALIPELSVAENICINREPIHPLLPWLPRLSRLLRLPRLTRLTRLTRLLSPIDQNAMARTASKTLTNLGLTGANNCHGQQAGILPLNIKQFIEIARELSRDDISLLLLDEPTAVFGDTDKDRLRIALKRLAAKGVAIIFVSHHIDELIATCDRLTVLRDGRVSGRFERDALEVSGKNASNGATNAATTAAITAAMVSHGVTKTRNISSPSLNTARTGLSLKNFSVAMHGDTLHEFNLDVAAGEILGLAGLSGSGRNSLGYGVMGLQPSRGHLLLDGLEIPVSSAEKMQQTGFFLVPEERHRAGVLLKHSIVDNICFSSLHVRKRFMAHGRVLGRIMVNRAAMKAHAEQCVQAYGIHCRSIQQKVGELSGGNQQKVCLAHALTLAPTVLFINEPTRGVDVSAREMILAQIIETCRSHGTTVIISSSELDELQRICDRIAVFHEGRLQTILAPDAEESVFASAMLGMDQSGAQTRAQTGIKHISSSLSPETAEAVRAEGGAT